MLCKSDGYCDDLLPYDSSEFNDTICSSVFSAGTPIDGSCVMPCVFDGSACVMPTECPPESFSAAGRCVPACVFWMPRLTSGADTNMDESTIPTNTDTYTDTDINTGKGIGTNVGSDLGANAYASRETGACVPLCALDTLEHALCAVVVGVGVGGEAGTWAGVLEDAGCTSGGELCVLPDESECAARVPDMYTDTDTNTDLAAILPCGKDCLFDPTRRIRRARSSNGSSSTGGSGRSGLTIPQGSSC